MLLDWYRLKATKPIINSDNPHAHIKTSASPILAATGFEARFAAVGGIFTRLGTSQRCWTNSTVDGLPFPSNPKMFGIEFHHLQQHLIEDTGFTPGLKPLMIDTAAHTKATTMNCVPLAISPKHIPDPIQRRSPWSWWTTTLARLRRFWKVVLNMLPQFVRNLKVILILRIGYWLMRN